jgi:general secretion pathway protein C
MPFDQVLKKNFWIVILPLVAIAAFLNAQAVTQLFGIGIMPDEKQLALPPAVAKVAPVVATTARVPNAEPLLQNNPFDHVNKNLKPQLAVADDGAVSAVDTSDPWNAPSCDGVKVLVITASTDPEWSFAALSASGETKSLLRRRGMDVGGKKVHFVGWDRVWFENSGALCQAKLFDKAEVKPAATPAPAPVASTTSSPTSGAKSVPDDIKKGIQKVGPNEYNIDRGVVDKILENQADLMRQARIVPEQENGRVVGIRLFGVRPDTLLGTLGMENGDRLQTINGFDMSSPEKALEVYARLRTADKLTVQVNRRGSNLNLDYHIK